MVCNSMLLIHFHKFKLSVCCVQQSNWSHIVWHVDCRKHRACDPGPLQWRHNGHDGVSNHQPHHCLLNRLFGCRSKKTSTLRVTGLCAGNSPGTGEFPAQMASNAENVSIWWRHHDSGVLVFGKAHHHPRGKSKHFPHYWPLYEGNPHWIPFSMGQSSGSLIFSLLLKLKQAV